MSFAGNKCNKGEEKIYKKYVKEKGGMTKNREN
jgi:hypothetical protein